MIKAPHLCGDLGHLHVLRTYNKNNILEKIKEFHFVSEQFRMII